MKKAIAIFLFLIAMSQTAFAGSFTGIWWNRSESGWGLNFAQQGDSIFATMYVYDRTGRPTWYLATMNSSPTAPGQFTGEMFEVSGPFYGNFFNPAAVASRRVGTMSFSAQSIASGALNYNVDGLAVAKTIEPFSFAPIPVAGTFAISIVRDPTNTCVIPVFNTSIPTTAIFTANSFQLFDSAGVSLCRADGSFTPRGSMASFAAASPSCYAGAGNILVLADVNPHGIAGATNSNPFITATAIFTNAAQTCFSSYYIAGLRTR
jgi:hypothetical protein